MTAVATGWVAVWGCYCSDAGMDPAQLPDLCPGHGTARVSDLAETWNGPPVPGHRCWRRHCTEAHPDQTPTAEIEEAPDGR